jgi:hypothetical protein
MGCNDPLLICSLLAMLSVPNQLAVCWPCYNCQAKTRVQSLWQRPAPTTELRSSKTSGARVRVGSAAELECRVQSAVGSGQDFGWGPKQTRTSSLGAEPAGLCRYGATYGRRRDQDERFNRARAQEQEARGTGRDRVFGGMPPRRWAF